MNLEDDVVITSKNFVRETFSYVQQREENRDDWSSLQFSNYLSIGRFYRSNDLRWYFIFFMHFYHFTFFFLIYSKLVELILLSYTRQPVDFIMHRE